MYLRTVRPSGESLTNYVALLWVEVGPHPGYRPSLMGLLGGYRRFGEASCLHPP